jgi:hypothetical protein
MPRIAPGWTVLRRLSSQQLLPLGGTRLCNQLLPACGPCNGARDNSLAPLSRLPCASGRRGGRREAEHSAIKLRHRLSPPRGELDAAGLYEFAVPALLRLPPCRLGQPLGQDRSEHRRHVLRDVHGHARQSRGQGTEHAREHLRSAGRAANGNHARRCD